MTVSLGLGAGTGQLREVCPLHGWPSLRQDLPGRGHGREQHPGLEVRGRQSRLSPVPPQLHLRVSDTRAPERKMPENKGFPILQICRLQIPPEFPGGM